MKNQKRKSKAVKKTKTRERQTSPHQERFDQLLDDAIFGVKKKNQRG